MAVALHSAPSWAGTLEVILEQLLNLLPAKGAALSTFDSTNDKVVIEIACGAWTHWNDIDLVPGEKVLHHMATTGDPYHNDDVANDPNFSRVDLLNDLHSVACTALIDNQQTLGALIVGGNEVYTRDELHLLDAISNIAVDALKRARLYESRERFINHILESIPSTLVAIDRTMRIASVNRNFLEKARRGAQPTLGRKVEEVFPPVLLEYTRLDEKAREVFRTGQSVEGGKVAYRAPGLPTRIYYYRLIPLKVGEIVENVMLLMDDITEQEKLGEEVQRAERHLASVVECASDLVISLDPDGKIVTWNQASEKISGLKAEQVKDQSLLFLCADDQRRDMAHMLQRLTCGEGVLNFEANLMTVDGQEVPIAWSCSPMQDGAGQVSGIVIVGRDMTERRQLEAQLIHTAKMASLGGMAGGIAHELRNPLGVISAGAQLLLEQPENDHLRNQCAEKINSAAKRASLIIENLLKFARPQQERMRWVDLNTLLEDTLTLLDHQLSINSITLIKEFHPVPKVYGNPELLQQVFTNLILNARNAMPHGGNLKIASQMTDEGRLEVKVSDTGHGIPPENLSKIFDPFFTTMPVGMGTGLGLSVSYSIVQKHNGSISVESKVGKGTTFTIQLPSESDNK